jgi:hypothetical protein
VSEDRLATIKSPKILSSFRNPGATKLANEEVIQKQIESMVKYFAMPFGVQYLKNRSMSLVQ